MERVGYFFAIGNIFFDYKQNQPKRITVGIIKITKTFTKRCPKTSTIITGMPPKDKTYSFRRTKIDKKNQILKAKSKKNPQTYFTNQDDDWLKSHMVLNEKFYCKDFLHLVETGNEKISKSFYLILKLLFT